jgi:hypothetical protein
MDENDRDGVRRERRRGRAMKERKRRKILEGKEMKCPARYAPVGEGVVVRFS